MADFDSTKTYFINGSSLKRLADIVREKIGKNVGMTLEQMGNYIYNLKTDGFVPPDGILITGDASYLLVDNAATAMVESAGDRIQTYNLTNVSYMFSGCTNLVSFPFTLNAIQPLNADGIFQNCSSLVNVDENLVGLQGYIKNMKRGFYNCSSLESVSGLTFDGRTSHNYNNLFQNCTNLKEIGYLENLNPYSMQSIFFDCRNLRECPEIINFDGTWMHTSTVATTEYGVNSMFYNCYSLRSVPEEWLKEIYNVNAISYGSYTNDHLYSIFQNCYALDEIRGLSPLTGTVQQNMFKYSFTNCHRLKDLIFDTQPDGTPYEVEWSSQHIDLSKDGAAIGWGGGSAVNNNAINYNSGITSDKAVTNATTYAALKNDPDWYSTNILFSRYNHDSAVRTINSLPDTSAYLASVGGGNNAPYNSIKFAAYAGQNTDGGAISRLTEEEIAVAVAKGWTVTLDQTM